MKRVFILALLLVTAMLAAESWEELLAEGRGLYEKEKYEEAIEVFTRAIKLLPEGEGEDAYLWRALANTELERYKEVDKDCLKALSINPDSAWGYNLLGWNYDLQEDNTRAIINYSKGLLLNNEYSIAYNNRGTAYEELGNYKEALKDYTRAVEVEPYYYAAINNRGELYQTIGRYRLALEDYKYLNKKFPEDSYYLTRLANVMISLYDYVGALTALNRALELSPKYGSAYSLRGKLYLKMGEREKALADYDKLFELYDEDQSYPHGQKAYYLSTVGDNKGALQELEKAYSIDSKDYYILKGLVHNALMLGDRTAAKSYLAKLKALKLKGDYRYYKAVAFILYYFGEYEEALTYINSSLEINRYDSYSLAGKGLILLNMDRKNFEEVNKIGRLMTRYRESDSGVLEYRAKHLAMMGDYEQAFSYQKKSLKLAAGDPYSYFIYYAFAKMAGSDAERTRVVEMLKNLNEKYMRDGWTDRVTAFIIGEIDKESLLKEAGSNRVKLCEANFYIAMSLLGREPRSEVKSYLENCVNTGVSLYEEYLLASYYLKNFHLIDKGEAK